MSSGVPHQLVAISKCFLAKLTRISLVVTFVNAHVLCEVLTLHKCLLTHITLMRPIGSTASTGLSPHNRHTFVLVVLLLDGRGRLTEQILSSFLLDDLTSLCLDGDDFALGVLLPHGVRVVDEEV